MAVAAITSPLLFRDSRLLLVWDKVRAGERLSPEDGQLLAQIDVIGFDNVHRGLECAGRAQFRPVQEIMFAHGFLP